VTAEAKGMATEAEPVQFYGDGCAGGDARGMPTRHRSPPQIAADGHRGMRASTSSLSGPDGATFH
jgi:hypothetical protein